MASRFDQVAPVLAVRSVRAALEHYRRLGFQAKAYDETDGGEPVYGFLHRDKIAPVYAEWKAAGVGGRLRPPEDTPYRLREFAHVDPDGNLLRIGSELTS